jgi:hypothetical protein
LNRLAKLLSGGPDIVDERLEVGREIVSGCALDYLAKHSPGYETEWA